VTAPFSDITTLDESANPGEYFKELFNTLIKLISELSTSVIERYHVIIKRFEKFVEFHTMASGS
jgi:hypothetical protein